MRVRLRIVVRLGIVVSVREGSCLGPYWLEASAAFLQRVEGAILLCRAWLGSGSGSGSGSG